MRIKPNKKNHIKKKPIKKKPIKKRGGCTTSDPSSILILVIPFIFVTTLVIIMLFQKVKCPIKDTMSMKVEELPNDQIVLIAAKDLKNKSLVTQPGVADTENCIAMSEDLDPNVLVLSTAGEVYPGTPLTVEMTENIWDTIPFSTKYINNKAWIPINDARACARTCMEHEWCKTMGVSQLGKCYISAMDMTNPMKKEESLTMDDPIESDDESDDDEPKSKSNTSLIMKLGTKDRQDDFEERD